MTLTATSIVVAHNHPSGDPTPSTEVRSVIEQLREAGELLDIPMLEYLVLGDRRYYSFEGEALHGHAGGIA